jgi:hypothetical protein
MSGGGSCAADDRVLDGSGEPPCVWARPDPGRKGAGEGMGDGAGDQERGGLPLPPRV